MLRSILLDLLRIIAISLVFIAHFGQILGWPLGDFFGVKNFYYVSLGGLGVSMFLVLSGVLAGIGEAGRKSNPAAYVYKKFLRIYPLYWLSIPISMAGYVLGAWLLKGDIPKLFPNGMAMDLWGSFTGFYAWMGLWGGPYNSPSWFIALIMSMYLIFPLLYFFIKKQALATLLATLGISIAARIYIGQEGVPFSDQSLFDSVKGYFYRQYGFMPGRPGDWFPLCRIFEFALGVYLGYKLPKTLWFTLNIRFTKLIGFLSDHAFSLFLVHSPFLFVVLYLKKLGVPEALAISVYMMLMFVAAYWMNKLDDRFPRKKLVPAFLK